MIYRILSFIMMLLIPTVIVAEADMFMITEAGTSARTVRLGKIEGFSTNASGLLENPASLYHTDRFSVAAFRTEFIAELPYQAMSVAFRWSRYAIGVSYMGLTVSDIDKTIVNPLDDPTLLGTFEYKNSLIKLGAAYSFSRRLHMGLALTSYKTSFDTVDATGMNGDLGFFWDNRNLDASLVFRNVIPSQSLEYKDSTDDLDNSSDGETEKIPLQTALGLRYAFKYADLYMQLKKTGQQRGVSKHAALDFKIPYVADFFRFSLGYKESIIPVQQDDEQIGTDVVESGMVMGIGLDLIGLEFDYALEKSDHVEFDTKHYFSAAFSF